ncbi:MAG: hypothetical protein JWQ09_2207 [Segetibacter sp.]|nr:hypothetical protein [Segetibacter sp.]
MSQIQELLYSPMFTFLWIGSFILASVIYRKSKGKPLYPRTPSDSIYSEKWASGYSNKNFITKLGGARNCLLVAITPTHLVISPLFPFNLMFLPEVYGLEYKIRKENLRKISESSKFLFKVVTLDFISESGESLSMSLKLKNNQFFIEKLNHGSTF